MGPQLPSVAEEPLGGVFPVVPLPPMELLFPGSAPLSHRAVSIPPRIVVVAPTVLTFVSGELLLLSPILPCHIFLFLFVTGLSAIPAAVIFVSLTVPVATPEPFPFRSHTFPPYRVVMASSFLKVWCTRWDSNPYCTDPKSVVSCQLDYPCTNSVFQ